MLTTTAPNTIIATAPATAQNTPQDARSEIEVNSGTSPANQVTKQLSDLNSKIVKIEQNLSLLADKMANMDAKIDQVEEAIKQSDSMQTNLDQLANDFNHQSGNIKDLQEKVSSNTGEINCYKGLQEIVEYLEKEVECGADSKLAKTLKNEIKQDLRQEMGRMKTDITDKVDRVGTELNSLVEKVTYMKASIKINSCRLQIISKATETWFNPAINHPMKMLGGFNGEIRNEERMLSELHPQIHKMVKEYQ